MTWPVIVVSRRRVRRSSCLTLSTTQHPKASDQHEAFLCFQFLQSRYGCAIEIKPCIRLQKITTNWIIEVIEGLTKPFDVDNEKCEVEN